eukprot:8635718-Pyramimonas_sp.AAC.1
MAEDMDLQTIPFALAVNVSRAASSSPDWVGAPVKAIGGVDFIELGKRIKVPLHKAAMDELGQDDGDCDEEKKTMSKHREKTRAKALKQLCDGATTN